MKKYIGKEPCPQCGSKDNVGVWSDGQKYCFGACGYFVPGHSGMSVERIREVLLQRQKDKEGKDAVLALPADFSLVIRGDALEWLESYNITDTERFRHKIGWSEIYESLIFPAFDLYGNLLLVQRRYFGNGPFPKYHTKGAADSVVWSVRPRAADLRQDPSDTYNGTIVVVEDFVSALKVGRVAEAMPLWGSHFSSKKLNCLSSRWEELVLWLDQNKTKEALKFREEAKPFFNNVWVVSTEKDPKAYNESSLSQYLIFDTDA